jgi:hypothetical protein
MVESRGAFVWSRPEIAVYSVENWQQYVRKVDSRILFNSLTLATFTLYILYFIFVYI